jgi:hypothetical protein
MTLRHPHQPKDRKALGPEIPPPLLALAEKVIE